MSFVKPVIAVSVCLACLVPVSADESVSQESAPAQNLSEKDTKIAEQAKQLETMRQQQEFQAQQIREMQLQRQETAHQTEQQRRDSQMLRYQVSRHGLLRNLLFDPPIKVRTPSTVTGQQSP